MYGLVYNVFFLACDPYITQEHECLTRKVKKEIGKLGINVRIVPLPGKALEV